jgi:hypothetical protein
MSLIGSLHFAPVSRIDCAIRSIASAFALLAIANVSSPAAARGGLGSEGPWASHHIDGLPPEIRRDVLKREPRCGPLRAQHYFSRSLSPNGSSYRFIALHFEEFGCDHRSAICTASGCLHQVYASGGTGYRRVFSRYVRELELKVIDGEAAIQTSCSSSAEACFGVQRWNGSSFVRRNNLDR